MEAQLVDELPGGRRLAVRAEGDGFRGILENLDGEVHPGAATAGRSRLLPELVELGERLPKASALDGEIVIEREGGDFDALQMRLHPAESRVRKLSAEIPAGFVVFDVLLWDGRTPTGSHRGAAEDGGEAALDISPVTHDRGEAQKWLDRLEVAGFDGVIAKRLGLPYMPGSREAVLKVKGERTADCVVVGVTWSEKGTASRALRSACTSTASSSVGSAPASGKKRTEILERVEPLLGPNPERNPRAPSRWKRGVELEWSSVPPELVVEVRYDKWQKGRFPTTRGSSASGRTRTRTSARSTRSAPAPARATRPPPASSGATRRMTRRESPLRGRHRPGCEDDAWAGSPHITPGVWRMPVSVVAPTPPRRASSLLGREAAWYHGPARRSGRVAEGGALLRR